MADTLRPQVGAPWHIFQFRFLEVQTLVSDLETALRFYSDVLGFRLKSIGRGWAIFDLGEVEFVVLAGATSRNLPTGSAERCGTMMVLRTSGLETAVGDLCGKGVRFCTPIVEVPQGRYARFLDPDGNVLELAEPR